MPIRVLFVCLGNICRSPAAEAAFRHARRRGRPRRGVHDRFRGDGGLARRRASRRPDAPGRTAGRGIEITSLARQVTREDFDRFDYILAMDASNHEALVRAGARRHITARFGSSATSTRKARVRTCRTRPIGARADFEEVLDIVTRTGEGLAGRAGAAGHMNNPPAAGTFVPSATRVVCA